MGGSPWFPTPMYYPSKCKCLRQWSLLCTGAGVDVEHIPANSLSGASRVGDHHPEAMLGVRAPFTSEAAVLTPAPASSDALGGTVLSSLWPEGRGFETHPAHRSACPIGCLGPAR
jgi:hypothetical protein